MWNCSKQALKNGELTTDSSQMTRRTQDKCQPHLRYVPDNGTHLYHQQLVWNQNQDLVGQPHRTRLPKAPKKKEPNRAVGFVVPAETHQLRLKRLKQKRKRKSGAPSFFQWNSIKINENSMKVNEIRWNSMKFNSNLWNSMNSIKSTKWNSMKDNDIEWHSMKLNEIRWDQWNSMKLNESIAIPWKFQKSNEIQWNSVKFN